MNKKVTVFYNTVFEAMLPYRGWQQDDAMILVTSQDVDFDPGVSDEDVCEAAFHLFNDHLNIALGVRSMSVGDAVSVDDKVYVVGCLGFLHVPVINVVIPVIVQGGTCNGKPN